MKAEQVLERYWDGTLPVDPIKIAQSAGIDIKIQNFSDDTLTVTGLLKGKKTIVISQELVQRGGTVLRFAVAHAIGHAMMHELHELDEGIK